MTRILKIPLTQGKVALIDADDLRLVDGMRWYAKLNFPESQP